MRLLCAWHPPAGLDPRCQAPASPIPPLRPCRLSPSEFTGKRPPTPQGRARDPCPEVSRNTGRNPNPTFWFCSLCCPAGLQWQSGAGPCRKGPGAGQPPCCGGSGSGTPAAATRVLPPTQLSAVSHRRTCSCHQRAASGHHPAPYGAGVEHLLQVGTCSSQSRASTHLSRHTPEPGHTCWYAVTRCTAVSAHT